MCQFQPPPPPPASDAFQSRKRESPEQGGPLPRGLWQEGKVAETCFAHKSVSDSYLWSVETEDLKERDLVIHSLCPCRLVFFLFLFYNYIMYKSKKKKVFFSLLRQPQFGEKNFFVQSGINTTAVVIPSEYFDYDDDYFR